MNQRKRSRKRFFRVLGLALLSCLCLPLCLPVAAAPIHDAVSDVGEAISDVGDAVSDAVSDMMNPENGTVSDSDGVIGDESEEATASLPSDDGTSISMGWIAVLIALAVVAVIVLAIVFWVPRRRVDD